jgi:hypothetical protein
MNTDKNLYFHTVPVFLNYAPRILAIAERSSLVLEKRLLTDTFSAGENLVIAQGFILRTVFPLLGQECPELSSEEANVAGITQRHSEIMTIISSLDVAAYKGAAKRVISHVAGDAYIKQSAPDYVNLFGMPNFFFHMTMGYATLRANGIKLGKQDFDGLHRYSSGFSFQE